MTNKEIMELFGFSRMAISKWCNRSNAGRCRLRKLLKILDTNEVKKRLKSNLPKRAMRIEIAEFFDFSPPTLSRWAKYEGEKYQQRKKLRTILFGMDPVRLKELLELLDKIPLSDVSKMFSSTQTTKWLFGDNISNPCSYIYCQSQQDDL